MEKLTRRILIIFCAVFLLSFSITGISAYFTFADTLVNVMSVGSNNIGITEEFPIPDPQPGSSHKKVVQVTNTGASDCYVRVMAVFSNSAMGDNCTIDWNTTDWAYNSEDGYWYYTKAITSGETTVPLFTQIAISDSISEYDMMDFDIIVYAESLQSRGFANYQIAWSEFKKNKPGEYSYEAVYLKKGSLASRISSSVSDITAMIFTDIVAPSTASLDDLSANGDMSVVGWLDGGTYYVSSQRRGNVIQAPQNSDDLFSGLTAVASFDFANFDTQNMTSAAWMFSSCKALTYIDLSGWKVQNLVGIHGMFVGCTSLEYVSFSGWNTSKLEYIYETFDGCSSLKSVDFTGWDTSSVEDMEYIFNGCSSLTSLDLSSWDTSSIEYANNAFTGCTAITVAFARTQTDADTLNTFVQKCSTTAKPLNWSFEVK